MPQVQPNTSRFYLRVFGSHDPLPLRTDWSTKHRRLLGYSELKLQAQLTSSDWAALWTEWAHLIPAISDENSYPINMNVWLYPFQARLLLASMVKFPSNSFHPCQMLSENLVKPVTYILSILWFNLCIGLGFRYWPCAYPEEISRHSKPALSETNKGPSLIHQRCPTMANAKLGGIDLIWFVLQQGRIWLWFKAVILGPDEDRALPDSVDPKI